MRRGAVGSIMLRALTGLFLGALAIRLPRLGAQSLWYDETVSALLAAKPLGALVAHTARDIHPPGYYVMLHFWRNLLGESEFALAFFSLWWGVLLIASVFALTRRMAGTSVALLSASLVALSPFNIWYGQEVRMYTLGATLGVWSLLALWLLLTQPRMKRRWMTLWVVSAVLGLYTLYYFALLLLWEGLFVALWLWRRRDGARARRWVGLAGLLGVAWLPWLPTFLRQVTTPPVPPWRTGNRAGEILMESLGALAVGQSLPFTEIQPWLLLLLSVLSGGLLLRAAYRGEQQILTLLGGALLFPLALLMASDYTPVPLYHVRYLFTFSPAFYILLALAFFGWAEAARRRARLAGALLVATLLLAPLYLFTSDSLRNLWEDDRFAADDLRGGVSLLESRWRTDDVALLNAGYIYPALDYYFQDPIGWQGRLPLWSGPGESEGLTVLQGGSVGGAPTLGWGRPESDFYAISGADTVASLERVAARAPRLWHFRLYDTVTDPGGLIRNWLDENALLFQDELLRGSSHARVQGWYFPPPPGAAPSRPITTRFLLPDGDGAPWITLHGVDLLTSSVTEGGSWVDVNLWLEGHRAMDPDTRLSLGLFDGTPAARQWAFADEKVLGPQLSLAQVSGLQRWPVRLRLPQGLPPDKYELRLKFYRPTDGVVLLGDGEELVNPQQVRLAVVEALPTRPTERPPQVGTPLRARFGPLELLGHAIPPGPWEPGASIPVELVWRMGASESSDGELALYLSSPVLASDNGGVTTAYPSSLWREGEVIRDVHYLTVAPDAAPGEYPLSLGVRRGAASIPWQTSLFRRGSVLPIGTLTIRDRERTFTPPVPEVQRSVTFGEDGTIELVGSNLIQPTYRAGDLLPVTLHLHAAERPRGRYKIFTHLIGPDGNLQAQRDLEPGEGLLPTNGWAQGEFVEMRYDLPLPATLPPGTYEVRVGLYDPVTGERLRPAGPATNPGERFLLLGTTVVEP